MLRRRWTARTSVLPIVSATCWGIGNTICSFVGRHVTIKATPPSGKRSTLITHDR
jgi:hypothetical protein